MKKEKILATHTESFIEKLSVILTQISIIQESTYNYLEKADVTKSAMINVIMAHIDFVKSSLENIIEEVADQGEKDE